MILIQGEPEKFHSFEKSQFHFDGKWSRCCSHEYVMYYRVGSTTIIVNDTYFGINVIRSILQTLSSKETFRKLFFRMPKLNVVVRNKKGEWIWIVVLVVVN